MNNKKGLGKGLSALFGVYDEEETNGNTVSNTSNLASINSVAPQKETNFQETVQQIDLDLCVPNPNQPRKNFDQVSLLELADSIKLHGVVQPIVLNDSNGKFLIIAGERRWRASKLAGQKTIPAIIKHYSEREIKEISIIENLQREDLNSIEAAKAIKQLMEDYSFTQEVVADRIGKGRATVANILRLLTLYPDVIEMIEKNRLSAGHGKCLATINNYETQIKFASQAADNKLSVRELEKIVRDYLNPKQSRSTKQNEQSIELKDLVTKMQKAFSTKVGIIGNDKKGRIYIDYYTTDDLDRIFDIVELVEAKKLTLKNLSDLNKHNII
ncbi:MAG: ParB/RepB/Spo0J family partition protein [Clostridia bacterium]